MLSVELTPHHIPLQANYSNICRPALSLSISSLCVTGRGLALSSYSKKMVPDGVISNNIYSCSIAELADLSEKSEEKAQGLPEPVVGEGGLLVLGEEDAVERVDLGLPNGVRHSPQGRQHVHNCNTFR